MTLVEFYKQVLNKLLVEASGEKYTYPGMRWAGKYWVNIGQKGREVTPEERRESIIRMNLNSKKQKRKIPEPEVRTPEEKQNMLAAIKHFSRNLGINLRQEHIQGINFKEGSLQDHIDQIRGRLQ